MLEIAPRRIPTTSRAAPVPEANLLYRVCQRSVAIIPDAVDLSRYWPMRSISSGAGLSSTTHFVPDNHGRNCFVSIITGIRS